MLHNTLNHVINRLMTVSYYSQMMLNASEVSIKPWCGHIIMGASSPGGLDLFTKDHTWLWYAAGKQIIMNSRSLESTIPKRKAVNPSDFGRVMRFQMCRRQVPD